jgi:gamma-glutamyltranspeptidase
MTPTIIAKNGKPHWVIGSPGGQTIISTKSICSSVPPTRGAPAD